MDTLLNQPRLKCLNNHFGVAIVVLCITSVWFVIKDLFPRIEFIQWLGRGRDSFSQSQVASGFADLFRLTYNDPGKYNARNFSWIFESGIGPICETNIACANTIAFTPVALYIIAIYLILKFVGCTQLESTFISAIVLFSFPSASILGWQATIPDRLAAFLFCSSLIYIYRNLEKSNLPVYRSALVCLTFFGLSLLSVSSKEVAWILLPITLALPYLFIPLNFLAIMRRVLITLPSILFMSFHISDNYIKTKRDSHLLGGDPFSNLNQLSRYIFGVKYSYTLIILIGVVNMYLLVKTCVSKQDLTIKIYRIRIFTILLIAFAGSWFIPLRTKYASPFYLWLPIGVTMIAIMILYKFSLVQFRSSSLTEIFQRLRRFSVWVLSSMVLATSIYTFPNNGALILKFDRNFQTSKSELVEYRKLHPDYKISFWAPDSIFSAYQFVSSDPASHLWYFLGGSVSLDETYAAQLLDSKCGQRVEKSAVVIFNEEFKIVDICSN